MTRRVLLVVLAALLFTTGCLGGSNDAAADPFADLPTIELDGSEAMLIAAVDRTSTVSSYRFAMLMEFSAPELGMDQMRFEVDGAADDRTGKAEMTLDMGPMFESVPASERAQVEQMFGDGKIEMVMSGSTGYIKFPMMAQMMGSSAEWVAVPAGTTGDALGSMGLAFDDPGSVLDDLRSVAEVQEVRTEVVGGVDTTMFSVVLDSADVDPTGMFTGDLPLYVWIDGNGVVRRIEMQFEVLGMTGGVVMEMFDFGVEVDPEIPADFVTIDPAALTG